MKKIRILITLLTVIFLTSCSAQEKINPSVFIERINRCYPEIIFDSEQSFCEDNCFVYFISFENQNNIAIRLTINENEVIKKISVSADKNDNLYCLFNFISEIYSPKEDNESIINNLKNNNEYFRYLSGKEHTYSVAENENSVYFEIYNNRLNDYTVPELTLKPNDKTEF